MNELREILETYDDIFVFGYNGIGRTFYDTLLGLGTDKPIRFCDSNAAPNAKPGAMVLTPDEAVKIYPNAVFCIGSITHSQTMQSQLTELGVPDSNILTTPEYILDENRRSKYVPRISLGGFEYHLTEHCNLKCAGCLHFSSIAEEEFADFTTFKQDMARIKEILGDDASIVRLCGGEPLLHPQFEDFIEYARTLLPQASIMVVTNGLLLPGKPDAFWWFLKQNRITLAMTKYPVHKKIEEITRKAKEFDVDLLATAFADNWNKLILDLDGKLDPKENFELCPRANGYCPRIYKGRLYPCPVVGNAEHFNRKFGTDLTHSKNDSLDIHSDITARDIYDFLARPIPFCRYCDVKNLKIQKWSLSKQEMGEYLG